MLEALNAYPYPQHWVGESFTRRGLCKTGAFAALTVAFLIAYSLYLLEIGTVARTVVAPLTTIGATATLSAARNAILFSCPCTQTYLCTDVDEPFTLHLTGKDIDPPLIINVSISGSNCPKDVPRLVVRADILRLIFEGSTKTPINDHFDPVCVVEGGTQKQFPMCPGYEVLDRTCYSLIAALRFDTAGDGGGTFGSTRVNFSMPQFVFSREAALSQKQQMWYGIEKAVPLPSSFPPASSLTDKSYLASCGVTDAGIAAQAYAQVCKNSYPGRNMGWLNDVIAGVPDDVWVDLVTGDDVQLLESCNPASCLFLENVSLSYVALQAIAFTGGAVALSNLVVMGLSDKLLDVVRFSPLPTREVREPLLEMVDDRVPS